MLFWRQFKVLVYKNVLVFRQQWLVNLLRCLIFPVAYGIFLGFATNFFTNPNNLGLGNAVPIFRVQDHFDGSRPIVWADNSGGSGYISAKNIMSHVTANFTSKQLAGVMQVQSDQALSDSCLSNFNGASGCFITVSFDAIPTASPSDIRALNYTIRSDYGSHHVDVAKHTSDLETKVIPMQWAIDQAIIELTTGKQTPLPFQLPFTHETNDNSFDNTRLFFLSLIGSFGGIAFLLAFIGILYQLAGGVALERAAHLTSHMQAMGALDSARILSWHLSVSALYFPTWIILALIWRARLFVETSAGLMILVHILTGVGLASWSFFISVPFSKSPQLAAVVGTGVAIVLGVIPLALPSEFSTSTATALSFLFPSMFYVFILKSFAGFELNQTSPSLYHSNSNFEVTPLPMVIAVVIGIFFWPCCAVFLERWMYGISNPSNTSFWSDRKKTATDIPSNVSISLRNVKKQFNTSFFRRKSREVIAIADLTLDIPSFGIFVLLGPNGAGKSTTLSILGGLTRATRGTVAFSGDTSRPPRGTLGIVPQKNVLFPELSCLQTLRVWNAIKAEDGNYSDEDLEQLIRDCDLHSKMHEPAGTLSGGQKRKLQLAIGLVGGSKIILVDECTSGVDPLSRRALWKTLTTYRAERTIILTTHFLDEADFLADRIAVLAAPGKLIASDTPVTLKSTMGEGYSISVKFAADSHSDDLLQTIQTVAPETALTFVDSHVFSYHLKTKDTGIIASALRLVENTKVQFGILAYEVLGTTIEDIFLDLLAQDEIHDADLKDVKDVPSRPTPSELNLSNGRPRTPWAQATTIFHKRFLIARRSWLVPLLAMAVGISGAWWPLRFVKGGVTSCAHSPFDSMSPSRRTLYPPIFSDSSILVAPPSLVSTFNASLPELFKSPFLEPVDNTTFNPFIPVLDKDTVIKNVSENFQSFDTQGGFVMDFDKGDYLIIYEMDTFHLSMFSLASNLFYSRALNASSSSRRIIPSFDTLPVSSSESLSTLQWLSFFGAAMAVFPAFFTLYVAKERHSSVQAMQLSNGLSNPLGLWLGHLMFDSMFTVIVATFIAIVYSLLGNKFQGVGLLWFVICLYGFAGTLLAYITAIIVKSPLGAFAILAVSQFIIFLLYLTGYIVTLFTALPDHVLRIMNIIHFTLALVSPVNSLTRAALVSVNQFSLLCDGEKVASGAQLGTITRYGGPILYLIVWILFLLFVLAKVDSGIRFPWSRTPRNPVAPLEEKSGLAQKPLNPDVLAEAHQATSLSNSDPLRVLNVSKTFGRNKVVDDVTFTIPHNSLFVMLGPNGAGKTTTFDMIRGHLKPETGDVIVNDTSIVMDMKRARVSFGVCPQFTAMDAHLTVQEHLLIYGRLRGLAGEDLQRNIASIMDATGLHSYAARLATKLSGGNQRKLALAIALIGNPSVVLVDEYSTGIDAKMKRELWAVLKQATGNKSVLLTTHSMEEASYLATKVGIMSKRMLAVGSPEELESRTASYEVHFSCPTREELGKVRAVMAKIPGARMVDDVATRFEVPVGDASVNDNSVASIFEILAREEGFPEFTVGKSSLETAFIRVINDDYAAGGGEEEEGVHGTKRKTWGLC
ncbi:hypothetical protein GALMADRAFT_389530 [Galerina marginata CBS 339.88]|uniref:ABC transporter domain-containing protein n=1 Tax=Galerina marginata (strain CBS 339.88) TaxID=685588 RepID=A0A067TRN3_GALM3|nr:hypothetical protein GALMADRAFT_389530 [Galerina marginata CBS 339.88]